MHGAKGAAKLRKRLAKILASIKSPEGGGGVGGVGNGGSWPLSAPAAKRSKLA